MFVDELDSFFFFENAHLLLISLLDACEDVKHIFPLVSEAKEAKTMDRYSGRIEHVLRSNQMFK